MISRVIICLHIDQHLTYYFIVKQDVYSDDSKGNIHSFVHSFQLRSWPAREVVNNDHRHR